MSRLQLFKIYLFSWALFSLKSLHPVLSSPFHICKELLYNTRSQDIIFIFVILALNASYILIITTEWARGVSIINRNSTLWVYSWRRSFGEYIPDQPFWGWTMFIIHPLGCHRRWVAQRINCFQFIFASILSDLQPNALIFAKI